jgi:hypothetical protein
MMCAASQPQAAVSLGCCVHGLGGWRDLERLRSEAIGTAGPARLARSGWHRWHGVARSRLAWVALLAWRRSTWIRSAWHGWLGNVWSGVARPRQARQAWHGGVRFGLAWLASQRIEWCGIARQAWRRIAWSGLARQARHGTTGLDFAPPCIAGMAWHRRPA